MEIGIILAVIIFGVLLYLGHRNKITTKIKTVEYTPIESKLTKFEAELINLINIHRKSIGLLEINKTDELARGLAYNHCKYLIDGDEEWDMIINHNNFSNRSIEMQTHGAKSVGEVVGYGYSTARGFLNGYLNSDSHRKILESKNYNYIGIRAVKNPKGRYFNTILFVKF